jgi:hypothetical protein
MFRRTSNCQLIYHSYRNLKLRNNVSFQRISQNKPICLVQGQVRSLSSILGAVKDRMTGQDEGSKKKQFKEMRDMLMSDAGITLTTIRDMLDTQTSSWMAMIPGNPQVDTLKRYVKVIDAMTDEQRVNPTKMTATGKIELAKTVEASTKDVDAIIGMFTQMRISSTWLKYKKYKGEQLPKNQAEYLDMQSFDRRVKYIASELVGSKNLPYKGKKYTKFLEK